MAGEEAPKILSVSAAEEIRMKDAFGALDKQMKGIGGTLHITKKDDVGKVGEIAWNLAEQTKLPVIVVVRAA